MLRQRVGLAAGLLPLLALPLLAPVATAAPGLDDAVDSLTGLAIDPSSGFTWTSDTSRVVAHRADGQRAGALTLDVRPTDVEGLAFGNGSLWIGDVGDRQGSRSQVQVLRVESPEPGSSARTERFVLRYPDGAHDAQAMTVSPNGRIYVITRGARPGIYRTSTTPQASTSQSVQGNDLTRIADAPGGVTDAAYSSDGSQLVLRSARAVHVIDGQEFTETASAALASGSGGFAMAPGQAGMVLSDGEGVLVDVALPATLVQLPDDAEAADPRDRAGSHSASPSARPARPAPDAGTGGGKASTVWALAVAGLISLAAVAVVWFKR
ncbi:hypothetical protein [Luteococcus sp.]|uniref:hypothetical protein n=1 Tax=Luteococcus sp. TaxID=1969402 RepID=UPI003735E552